MGLLITFLLFPEVFSLETRLERIVPFGLLTGYLFFAVFSMRAEAFEFFHGHFRVELSPSALRAYNIRGRETQFEWDQIVTIKPTKTFFLSWSRVHLMIINTKGDTLVIHHNIEPLGECIAAIEKRCPNLESVDYGGLDKTDLWTETNKL